MFVKPLRQATTVTLATILVAGCLTCSIPASASAAEKTFEATDTPRAWSDKRPETEALLERIAFEPSTFEVRCTSTPGLPYDALVRFDSPAPTGQRWVDEVVLRWYAARDEQGEPLRAPAVLVVHTLHPGMVIADRIARIFARRGLHAFMIELPGFGQRWDGSRQHPGVTALEHGQQAIADCLRARDAIAALPNIADGPVGLQGTSLGGFVAATAGGVETAFDPVVLLISGGDGFGTLTNGKHDALRLRLALESKGYRGDALRDLLDPVEPLHVAHRLDPRRTWLISARDDMTIPRAGADALARQVGLDDEHRRWVHANHYTILVLLPAIADHMAAIVLGEAPDVVDPAMRDGR
jgi:hypothetical protein